VVEARRKGEDWYLAAISDHNGRELTVPLKFLGKGDWKVTLWEDAPDSAQNPERLIKDERTVSSSETLRLKLAPSGGTVAIISPVK
jgi:alpha-glucosidase